MGILKPPSSVVSQETDSVGRETHYLYDIGDAAGCPPFGKCGKQSFPTWTQANLWYISYGCYSCKSTPMIYSNDWSNAIEWQQISKYSKQAHGNKIYFNGTTTQFKACIQRSYDTSCPYLDNAPEEGYNQLFTVLNSDPDLALSQSIFKWSTDMKW